MYDPTLPPPVKKADPRTERAYNDGFADSNQHISMTVRPILIAVLKRYGADMAPEMKHAIEHALRELWPFEEEVSS